MRDKSTNNDDNHLYIVISAWIVLGNGVATRTDPYTNFDCLFVR